MFSLEHVHAVRAAEIEKIIPFFHPGARILEIGAGTGQQALTLMERGFDVLAIEMADSGESPGSANCCAGRRARPSDRGGATVTGSSSKSASSSSSGGDCRLRVTLKI